MATHNHFALDRGGKVFNRTAPVIKLPEGAGEDEHLGLLGVLNSSTACFWLKQVCQPKGAHLAQSRTREERFAFNATNVAELPISFLPPLELAREIDRLAHERATLLDELPASPLRSSLADRADQERSLDQRLISLQEELDWEVMASFDLLPSDLEPVGRDAPPIELGQRAFEIVLARQVQRGEVETTWFERHGSQAILDPPSHWPEGYSEVVRRRIELIESDPDIALLERPEHKRRWARGQSFYDRQREALSNFVLDHLEAPELWSAGALRSTAELADVVRSDTRLVEACELIAGSADTDVGAVVEDLVVGEAVPFLAALRHTAPGLRKRGVWDRVWDLQRQEDRIDALAALAENDSDHITPEEAQRRKQDEVGPIPVPPRYTTADFSPGPTWRLRGKLDVPKERFVLIPAAERGANPSPVVGWAGWSERDRARALATRIVELREQEAAEGESLIPLLAGLLELLPWIHQWHPETDPAYNGPPGDFFELWLDDQLAGLGLTRGALESWRPPARSGRRRRRAGASA